ncbi:hypothetical protein L1987_56365 [Smallanthus sonchifolius]|uniref:Uncharacterized protein n=1 Tax=Smallanthus sonchifolius TaxID=185202 RepID=A0ACB9EC85_9ASTR|nr:hypothetical protein L1987_56365 [Smallanthus sonchifolius]
MVIFQIVPVGFPLHGYFPNRRSCIVVSHFPSHVPSHEFVLLTPLLCLLEVTGVCGLLSRLDEARLDHHSRMRILTMDFEASYPDLFVMVDHQAVRCMKLWLCSCPWSFWFRKS